MSNNFRKILIGASIVLFTGSVYAQNNGSTDPVPNAGSPGMESAPPESTPAPKPAKKHKKAKTKKHAKSKKKHTKHKKSTSEDSANSP